MFINIFIKFLIFSEKKIFKGKKNFGINYLKNKCLNWRNPVDI